MNDIEFTICEIKNYSNGNGNSISVKGCKLAIQALEQMENIRQQPKYIIQELENVIEKYKDKTFCTGELNFVEMAKTCKIVIQDLLKEGD